MKEYKQLQVDQRLSARWGEEILSHGWTAFPNLMFTLCRKFRIKHGDVFVLLAIESHRWSTANPYPSISTIARLSGYSEREVYRSLKRLEEANLTERKHTSRKSNEYDNTALIKQLNDLSRELRNRQPGHPKADERVTSKMTIRSDKEDPITNVPIRAYAQTSSFYISEETHKQSLEIARLFQEAKGGPLYRDRWETDMLEELIESEGFEVVRSVTRNALAVPPSELRFPDDENRTIPLHRPIKICDYWHELCEVAGY